jgi:hypothetical protein
MLIHADRAEDAMRASDVERMLAEWREVVRLAQIAGEQPETEALIGYTRAAEDLNRRADIERGLRLLADRQPDDTWSLGQLGWIYARAHRDEQAWPLLMRAAERDDAWAQFVVGNDTYRGVPALHKSADQAAGLVWIRRSAAQCFPDALRFLAAHGESPPVDCRRQVAKRDWDANGIRWGGVALLTSLVMRWMAASRKRAPASEQSGRLRHPLSTLILGTLVFAFFAVLAILCNVYDNGTAGPLVTAVFLGFGALGLVLVAEYCRARHELTSDGLNYGRLFGPRGQLLWQDVVRVSYSPGMRWFRIETSAGSAARISAMLTGLPEFARAVLTHVPGYAIDEATRTVLESTSQGELPTLAA